MTDKRPRRPSLFALVALALVLACLTVSGALAKGRTHVLTGEGVYIHPGGFVDVTPGDVVTADSHCPAGYDIISGGYDERGSITLNVVASHTLVDGHNHFAGWEVQVVNPPLGQDGEIQAVSICGKYTSAEL